jgi:hypothetical protein
LDLPAMAEPWLVARDVPDIHARSGISAMEIGVRGFF